VSGFRGQISEDRRQMLNTEDQKIFLTSVR